VRLRVGGIGEIEEKLELMSRGREDTDQETGYIEILLALSPPSLIIFVCFRSQTVHGHCVSPPLARSAARLDHPSEPPSTHQEATEAQNQK
jgi:hypothetical protein